MIGHIKVRERGSTPRRMRKQMSQLLKATWQETGVLFHTDYRAKRFTHEHARAAQYTRRKRRYMDRKRATRFGGGVGQALPLVHSSETQRTTRQATISSTSKGVKVRYPGARKLNLRHPASSINMAEEFRRVTTREARELAKFFDGRLDDRIDMDTSQDTRTVA